MVPYIPKTLILRFTLVCKKAQAARGHPAVPSAHSHFMCMQACMHAALLGPLIEPTEFTFLIAWAVKGVTIVCRQHVGTNSAMLLPCTHTVCCFLLKNMLASIVASAAIS